MWISSKHNLGNYAAEPKRVEFPACGVRTAPGSRRVPLTNQKMQKRRAKLMLERAWTGFSRLMGYQSTWAKVGVAFCSYFAEIKTSSCIMKAVQQTSWCLATSTHPLLVIDTASVPYRPEPQPRNSGQCNVGIGLIEPGPRVPRAQGLLSPASIEFTHLDVERLM